MKLRAYAKINLGLNVVGRRENGYHDLEMIMVPITFYDELEISIADEMSFTCNKSYVGANKNNTIFVAIEYLRQQYGFKENFKINLNKHIPTRAGLAGGSADGAMTIVAVDLLLKLGMNPEERRQAALAVGSDVYFCLVNKCAKVLGTGDIVEPFKCNLDPWILLVKPKSGVSTKESFESLNLELCDHPDVEVIKEALEKADYDLLIKSIGNSLEEPSFKLNKEISAIKQDLLDYGLDAALMSGSGSTVFGLSNDANKIDEVMSKMRNKGYFVRKCRIKL